MAAAEPSAQALEVDEWTRDDDQDSTYTASIASSSESLASSIFRHRQENGRTYHAFKEGKYVLPNDQHKQRVFPNTQRAGNNTQETYDADYGTPPNAQNENDRLDLQHTLFRITFGDKLFVSPGGGRGSPHRVLDAGTGTGIWAVDYADENPEAEVVGVDLSAIQPDFVPVNLSFFIDDLEDPWTFNTKFDFIYGRMLTGSLRDWPKFIQQSYDNLESGGWLEIADILLDFSTDDNTIPADSPASKWGRLMLEAADKFGAPLDSCKRYKEQLVEAGFVDVVQEVYKWPSYVWPKDPKFKEMGMWTYENLGNGASGLSLALFTRALGWTAEEVEIFLVDVRNDMKNLSVHAWWPIYVVYGRKP